MPHAVNDNNGESRLGPCPICGKQGEERWRPFCSRRCADVDLHRWLSGSYAIPATSTHDGDEESANNFQKDAEAVDK